MNKNKLFELMKQEHEELKESRKNDTEMLYKMYNKIEQLEGEITSLNKTVFELQRESCDARIEWFEKQPLTTKDIYDYETGMTQSEINKDPMKYWYEKRIKILEREIEDLKRDNENVKYQCDRT